MTPQQVQPIPPMFTLDWTDVACIAAIGVVVLLVAVTLVMLRTSNWDENTR